MVWVGYIHIFPVVDLLSIYICWMSQKIGTSWWYRSPYLGLAFAMRTAFLHACKVPQFIDWPTFFALLPKLNSNLHKFTIYWLGHGANFPTLANRVRTEVFTFRHWDSKKLKRNVQSRIILLKYSWAKLISYRFPMVKLW